MPQAPSYFLLKARAEQLPLRDRSVRLVIATPPYFGALGVAQRDCPTRDAGEYENFLGRVLDEAARVVVPGGCVVLHTTRSPVRKRRGVARIVFEVLRRPARGVRHGELRRVARATFSARYVRLAGIDWAALPVWVYQRLVRRYSRRGDFVAHVFSGSGNGALAALALKRTPVLVDLHYHRLVGRRLREAVAAAASARRRFSA